MKPRLIDVLLILGWVGFMVWVAVFHPDLLTF